MLIAFNIVSYTAVNPGHLSTQLSLGGFSKASEGIYFKEKHNWKEQNSPHWLSLYYKTMCWINFKNVYQHVHTHTHPRFSPRWEVTLLVVYLNKSYDWEIPLGFTLIKVNNSKTKTILFNMLIEKHVWGWEEVTEVGWGWPEKFEAKFPQGLKSLCWEVSTPDY